MVDWWKDPLTIGIQSMNDLLRCQNQIYNINKEIIEGSVVESNIINMKSTQRILKQLY
jgi:hypothetical protein